MGETLTCIECGEPFELLSRKGKPRRRCYDCSPARPGQTKTGGDSHDEVGLTPASAKPPAAPSLRNSGRQCAWCHAYLPESNGTDWCNPNHRAKAAEKMAAEQQRREQERQQHPNRRMESSVRTKRSGNRTRVGGATDSRHRGDQVGGSSGRSVASYPAQVSYPVDPPTFKGTEITEPL